MNVGLFDLYSIHINHKVKELNSDIIARRLVMYCPGYQLSLTRPAYGTVWVGVETAVAFASSLVVDSAGATDARLRPLLPWRFRRYELDFETPRLLPSQPGGEYSTR